MYIATWTSQIARLKLILILSAGRLRQCVTFGHVDIDSGLLKLLICTERKQQKSKFEQFFISFLELTLQVVHYTRF